MGVESRRTVRALRLLLLFVLALTAVEYRFGFFLDNSSLQTNLYFPMHNVTPTLKDKKVPLWFKKVFTPIANSTNKQSVKETLNTTRNKISEDITKTLVTIKEHFVDEPLPLYGKILPNLGPITVNKTEIELDRVEKHYPEVRSGGLYSPPNCTARHRVAIIVPYRDRQQHLAIFLNHMHPFLMKQQLEYCIYIVEQTSRRLFNRAKLMNVGFVESLKQRSWQCFIFHDIDLLPLDSRNLYSCPIQPRHMSASIEIFNFSLSNNRNFGGVSAMTQEQFSRVNGFSNKYWGWVGEDNDMSYRLKKMHYHIARYKMSIARYAMLDHKKSAPNSERYQLLSQTSKTFRKDGLSTLEYELVKVTPHQLYTHMLINIDEHS